MNKNNRSTLLHALMNIENCNKNLQNTGNLNLDAVEIIKESNIMLEELIYKMLKADEQNIISLKVALELPTFLNLSNN